SEKLELVCDGIGLTADHLEIEPARSTARNALGNLREILLTHSFRASEIGIHAWELARRHEVDSRDGADVVDVFAKPPESSFRLFSRPLRRRLPFLARRVGPAPEI